MDTVDRPHHTGGYSEGVLKLVNLITPNESHNFVCLFMSGAYRLGTHFSANFVDKLKRQVIFFGI